MTPNIISQSIAGIKSFVGLEKKIEQKRPKILYFDIETTPDIVATFNIKGKQSLSHKQILKRSVILCISWAWNTDKVQSSHFDLSLYDWYKKDDNSDFELLKKFVTMAQEADLVIGHNAKFFDVAKLRSRLVKYRKELNYLDFKPTLIDDTYLSIKDIGFETHKLDDVSDYIGIGGKMPHGDGYEWWIEVMRGDKKILKEMVKYCCVDVEKTRTLYAETKPFTDSSLNMAVFYNRPEACPNPLCGQSTRPLIIRGYYTTKAGRYPKLQCPVCGKYAKKGKNMLNKKETGHAASEYNR